MSKKSILLVEDDIEVRTSTKEILEEIYNVFEASRYSEAVNHLKSPIDLAIIDYILPDLDGFDLLKAIRKVKPSLPVIMITGYSCEDAAIKAVRAGATDYMKKPLNIFYLIKRIAEIIGGEEDKRGSELAYVKNRAEFLIDGIAAYIDGKYMEDITRKKMADRTQMNRNKFCKVFKKRFGQTFTSYLNSVRAKKAAELLKNLDLTVTEIAYFIGYKNVVHFERIFKGAYGISPREYRKKLNQGDL